MKYELTSNYIWIDKKLLQHNVLSITDTEFYTHEVVQNSQTS